MRHSSFVAIAAIVLLVATAAAQEETINVRVVNLPEVQNISGSIAVSEPVPHSRVVTFENVVVSQQIPRDDVNRLVFAGTLDTAGFTNVVVSLAGEIKGTVPAAAELGAVLVPDVELVADAFQRGYVLFPIEVTAKVPANSAPYVGSEPKRFDLAFPRYRVYLFNTGSRAIGAQLYALLTH